MSESIIPLLIQLINKPILILRPPTSPASPSSKHAPTRAAIRIVVGVGVAVGGDGEVGVALAAAEDGCWEEAR